MTTSRVWPSSPRRPCRLPPPAGWREADGVLLPSRHPAPSVQCSAAFGQALPRNLPPGRQLPRYDEMVVRLLRGENYFTNPNYPPSPLATPDQLVGDWKSYDLPDNWRNTDVARQPSFRARAMDGGRPSLEFQASRHDVLGGIDQGALQVGTLAIEFQLTAAANVAIPQAYGHLFGLACGVLWLYTGSDSPSISWRSDPTHSPGGCVGFGGVSGAALTPGRHVILLTYAGGDSADPANYTATYDGVPQTLVRSFSNSIYRAGIATNQDVNYPYSVSVLMGSILAWTPALSAKDLRTVGAVIG